jgi:hypothetical protein
VFVGLWWKQEGETEYFDVALEDKSSNVALEQNNGDEFKDDNVVEAKKDAIDIQCATDYDIVVRLQEDVGER